MVGRAGLAIGGVVLIGAGLAIGFGWVFPSTAEATGEISTPVRAVEIANDSGDVKVVAADVDRTTVRQRLEYRWDRPADAYTLTGDKLVLDGCGWSCSVSYEVTVPRGAGVTGGASSGDVVLDGLASVDVHADSGDVEAKDVTGPVTVRLDSGSFTGQGLRGNVDADLDSGDAEVTMAEAGDVRVQADSGDVELTVPDGPYRVEGSTDSGDREVEVAQSPSTGHLLLISTDSGDVTIRAA